MGTPVDTTGGGAAEGEALESGRHLVQRKSKATLH